jgi:histone-arginine methyltransferase CARM1
MEVSSVKKLEQLEYSLESVTDLSSSSVSSSSPAVATFSYVDGVTELRFLQSDSTHCFNFDLASAQLFKLGPVHFICVSDGSSSSEEKSFSKGVNIKFKNEKDSKDFCESFEEWRNDSVVQGSSLQNGTVSANKSKFDNKIEASSAKMYFHYYGQLLHQQNMLQDYVRTGTYYAAVMENHSDFAGRVVVDVGAGSGILSMFAAQAGAKHVYAVEASEMAEYARKLIAGNPLFADRITVIKGKVEDIELPEKADILISEPMGTLLVNERMLESYVIARDRFMTPKGKMFPTVGR